MNHNSTVTHKPVFLLCTLAIPLGLLFIFLISAVSSILFPDHRGGNIGGNASAQEYFVFFGTCAAVVLADIILAAISSIRKERFLDRGVGFWMLCVIPAVVLIVNIVGPVVKHIVYP